MKNRVKKLAVAILILVAAMAVCFAAFIVKDSGGYEFGSVSPEVITEDSDDIVLEGVSFSISAGQLWETAQMEIWAGVDEAEAYAHAEKSLVEKYAMYHMASANGILPDEAAVRSELEYNREISETASNYEDFKSFLDYVEMTHDEYWDGQYENLLEYDVIDQYKEKLKNEYIQSGKSDADWEGYYSQFVADKVKKEKIKVIQPN